MHSFCRAFPCGSGFTLHVQWGIPLQSLTQLRSSLFTIIFSPSFLPNAVLSSLFPFTFSLFPSFILPPLQQFQNLCLYSSYTSSFSPAQSLIRFVNTLCSYPVRVQYHVTHWYLP